MEEIIPLAILVAKFSVWISPNIFIFRVIFKSRTLFTECYEARMMNLLVNIIVELGIGVGYSLHCVHFKDV